MVIKCRIRTLNDSRRVISKWLVLYLLLRAQRWFVLTGIIVSVILLKVHHLHDLIIRICIAVGKNYVDEVSCVSGHGDPTYEFLSRCCSSSDDPSKGGYTMHRRCYQDYTNKINVLRLLCRKQAESSAVKEAIPLSA